MDLLLSLRGAGYLQPLRGGLDGGRAGEREVSQTVAAGELSEAKHRAEQLTIHSNRGPAMTSKPVALLLADLGVTRSLSRLHVSNDNPFSESQFKTLKCCPEFPERFGSLHAQLQQEFLQLVQPDLWHNLTPDSPTDSTLAFISSIAARVNSISDSQEFVEIARFTYDNPVARIVDLMD